MKPHPFDPRLFVAGLLFCALAVAFALDAADVVTLDLRWLQAVVLLGLGVAGIASSATRARRDARTGVTDTP